LSPGVLVVSGRQVRFEAFEAFHLHRYGRRGPRDRRRVRGAPVRRPDHEAEWQHTGVHGLHVHMRRRRLCELRKLRWGHHDVTNVRSRINALLGKVGVWNLGLSFANLQPGASYKCGITRPPWSPASFRSRRSSQHSTAPPASATRRDQPLGLGLRSQHRVRRVGRQRHHPSVRSAVIRRIASLVRPCHCDSACGSAHTEGHRPAFPEPVTVDQVVAHTGPSSRRSSPARDGRPRSPRPGSQLVGEALAGLPRRRRWRRGWPHRQGDGTASGDLRYASSAIRFEPRPGVPPRPGLGGAARHRPLPYSRK
jgi:hypothetical protein